MSASGLQAEIKKRKPFSLPEQEACLNVLKTQDKLLSELNALFKQFGLSHPKYNVLRILRGVGRPGLPCQEIAERMINRVPDITRLVDRLQRDRLAVRAQSGSDRRVVLVRLTPKGRRLLGRLDEPVNELNRRQLAHLTRSELRQLNRLLVKARHPETHDGAIEFRRRLNLLKS